MVLSIWHLPVFGDDFGLLFGGKNADRILKLLVREIKLSEHVETGRRLRRVRFDEVQFDVVDVVQTGPFPPLPESLGHVQGHAQGGFVRHSLLFASWAAFPGLPESEATNSYGGLRTFASLGPSLCEAKIGLCGFRIFPTEAAFRVVARIHVWILRHHGVIRTPIMTSSHTAHRSDSDRVQFRADLGSTSSPSDCPFPVVPGLP